MLRQRAAGATERDVRALLRRRNLWLLVFGFVHAALLWLGDVLGAYGFAGLIFGWLFLRRTDRTLLVWSGIFTGLLAALTALSVLAFIVAPEGAAPAEPAESGSPSWFPSSELNAEENYLASMVLRIQVWAFLVVGQGLLTISVPIAILLGFWAARRRILEEPGNHLRLLRITAAWASRWAGSPDCCTLWTTSASCPCLRRRASQWPRSLRRRGSLPG